MMGHFALIVNDPDEKEVDILVQNNLSSPWTVHDAMCKSLAALEGSCKGQDPGKKASTLCIPSQHLLSLKPSTTATGTLVAD